MNYENIMRAVFLDRPNRFLAHVRLDGQIEPVHVKNTGRCAELLIPGAEVWHERALLDRMLEGTEQIPGVRHIPGVHVISDNPDLTRRDLIVALTFDGKTCADVAREYEKRGVIVNERVQESLYSARQVRSLGVPGIVRITPLHCHRIDEIDRFLKITAEIAAL